MCRYMLIYHLDGTCEKHDSATQVFRKMTNSLVELHIANMLLHNSNPNIVTIYNVTTTYIDMELLNTNYTINSSVIDKMNKVKLFLQSMNIAYIDWKPDNIGLDAHGEPKLFDFDGCGIFTPNNNWTIRPFSGYAYKKISQMESNPQIMDDMCFNQYLQ
jgi:serine/threonine protein kinase